MMDAKSCKEVGAYYTPDEIAVSLVRWAVRSHTDRMLDPACGDGRFLALHRRSAGVEQDPEAMTTATSQAPWAMIHEGDFFKWAAETKERFECAAGNPPFIRYQRFTGDFRQRAITLCKRLGANFSGLTSSWAPFLVATASLLKRGGRMAFVVPAEIGHAPYAVPLLSYLSGNFSRLQLVAVRRKIFTELSEDCWLLYADRYGGRTDYFELIPVERFASSSRPPKGGEQVSTREWKDWNYHLRPFLMRRNVRSLYRELVDSPKTRRFGDIADVGIGYVTGANEFFHLRPSAATEYGIPDRFLHPSVRNSRLLKAAAITPSTVRRWIHDDQPVLLLRIRNGESLPPSLHKYLTTPEAAAAKSGYKCRNRHPWYVVPDVSVPDAFLSYMTGDSPSLVANRAECVCTNSVHAVKLKGNTSIGTLQQRWRDPLTTMSCEIEGHPLGGGMLKLEPREAQRVAVPMTMSRSSQDRALMHEGIETMRRWRHIG